QVLDEGHLTDNYGRVIDFKNTVVIMTSNVGSRDMVKGKALGFAQPDARATFEKLAEKVKEEINKTFNPEFLNRLDDVIVFHPLTRAHITQIVAILLRDVQKRLGEEELALRSTPTPSWCSDCVAWSAARCSSRAGSLRVGRWAIGTSSAPSRRCTPPASTTTCGSSKPPWVDATS